MEPSPLQIENLALYDPVSAYAMLLKSPRAPVTMNCKAVFTTVNQVQNIDPIESVSDIAQQRTWIDKVDFSLVAPGLDPGIVLSTMAVAMLKQQPGISVRVWVEPEPRYVVASQYTPLENFVNILGNDRWPSGWMLRKQQAIHMSFIPTQQPPVTSEPFAPYTVVTTFTGWQFLDPTFEWLSRKEACTRLRKMGIRTFADEAGAIGL